MSADIIEFGSKEVQRSPTIGMRDDYYSSLIKVLLDLEVLPAAYTEDDIDLDEPDAEEKYLGELSDLERKLFVAYTIGNSIHYDSVVDRADYWYDRLRKEGVDMLPNTPPPGYIVDMRAILSLRDSDPFQFLALFLNDDERKQEHRKILTLQAVNSMYAFSINEHFGAYGHHTIERVGFTLYSY